MTLFRRRGLVGACTRLLLMILVISIIFVANNIRILSITAVTQSLVRIDSLLRSESRLFACSKSLADKNGVSCTGLIRGDPDQLAMVKDAEWVRADNNTTTECSLLSLTQDCNDLTRAHGYDAWPVSDEERAFPIAFAIRLHKEPEQAEQLLRTMYRPHNFYCIHVDANSNDTVFEPLRRLGRCFSNVHVLTTARVRSVYSSIRLVEAELACMREALAQHASWKYYLPLTGQEFVLKTNAELVAILQILNGTNDIESFPFPDALTFRIKKKHVLNENSIVQTSIPYPNPPRNITLRKGSAYGSFSRAFVEYVITDDFAGELIAWLAGTYAPEETIWSTLNFLPGVPGGFNVTTEHSTHSFMSRAMTWQWDPSPCKGEFLRSVCVYSSLDLSWLVSQPEIILNKFDRRVDQVAIDCLEDVLRERARIPQLNHLQWYFYRNLPHVKLRE